MSWPGTTETKNGLLNCTQCHTLERVARSTHNADEWVKVLQRMGRYAQGSTPERPQLRPNEHGGGSQQSDPSAEHGRPRGRGSGDEGPRRRGSEISRVDQPQ
jgi:hypothetical protein